MSEQNLFQKLSLKMDPILVLLKEEKRNPSARHQQAYFCTGLGIPEEELRNLSSEGDFTTRDLNTM